MDKDVSIFIGYDPRETEAFAVCRHSLQKHAPGVPIYALILDELREVGLYERPLSRHGAQLWDDISEAPMSTEFAVSRFLTPIVAKTKWAMFLDCDMLAVGNLDRLWAQLDDSKALYCVQHPAYMPPDEIKMDGQIQTRYARKNWSSVMIFNLHHPSNKKLTLGKVNTLPGRDLHRFCWLEDDEIGELDQEWNYLVGVTSNEVSPTIIHYTSGMPFMPGYEACEYADEWQKARREWLVGTHTKTKRNPRGCMLISPEYRAHNKALHLASERYGSKGNQWAGYIAQLVEHDGHASVLDYGAGKGTLAADLALDGIGCHEYDPAVPGKDTEPSAADLVICTDVLEHIEPDCLDTVLAHLASLTKRKLFLDICTRPAVKFLSDGRNAHLSLHDADWWKAKIAEFFQITVWADRPDCRFVYGEAVPLGAEVAEPKRRKMSPEVSAFFDMVRSHCRKHADGMSMIQTIRVYEGDVTDKLADMQIVCDILEGSADPSEVICRALKFSRKTILIRDRITPERSEQWWKDLLSDRIHIGDWTVSGDRFCAIGAPRVYVKNVTVVGARPSDERWEQVLSACKRIDKRVAMAPAHTRRAIIACYGPSLRETLATLKSERADDVDVVSVSGAHDFLIENGVVPTFHVECDPRAHKADNIDISHPRVKYLIGSGCHPVLLDKLEGANVALWHIATPEHMRRFVEETKEPANIIISGGGSVGLRAVSLMYTMGYRRFSIYGMDCSFADDGQTQWAGRHFGKRQDVVTASVGSRTFATSLTLLSYASDFIEMIQRIEIDCGLYGDGLLQSMVAAHAEAAKLAA